MTSSGVRNSELRGKTEPRLFTKPLRELTPETSHGFSVIEFALTVLGIDLYPWQKWLLIHALELNEDGTYRFRKIFVLVGRQNGKTTLLEVLALWWLFMDADSFPEHLPAHEFLILGTAQNLDLAEEAWNSALKRCDPAPEEDDEVFVVEDLAVETRKPVRTNGKKSLRLKNGAKYEPRAASRMGGRGKSAARVVMDEMREQQTWDIWGSVSKTKNAIFNSQLWGISSAGDAKSIVLRTLRDGAIRTIQEYERYVETGIQSAEEFANSHDIATALFEWSAEPGGKLLDIDGILQSNPSVGYKPMFFESIWSDLLGDEPEWQKRTEILCDWVTTRSKPFIDGEEWSDAGDGPVFDDDGRVLEVGSQIAAGSRLVMGICASGNRNTTSIAIAGYRDDQVAHVEVIEHGDGMLWAVDYAIAVRKKTGCRQIAVHTTGPSEEFIKPLKAAKFQVIEISGAALKNSPGRIRSRISAGLLKHRSQPLLDMSIGNATALVVAGGNVWDLYDDAIDASPAAAVTNALFGLETAAPIEMPPPPPAATVPAAENELGPSEVNIALARF